MKVQPFTEYSNYEGTAIHREYSSYEGTAIHRVI